LPRRHIALLLRDLRVGGAERTLLRLAEGLAEDGHRVDLLLVRRRGPLVAELPPKVRVLELPRSSPRKTRIQLRRVLQPRGTDLLRLGFQKLPRVLSCLPALTDYLDEERPALLITTLTTNNLAAIWAGMSTVAATRVVIREAISLSQQVPAWSSGYETWLPALIRRWYPEASAVVANSAGSAADLQELAGLSSDQVAVIPNSVDVDQLLELASQPLSHAWLSKGRAPVILGVGRLEAQKDFGTLIGAFSRLQRNRDLRLMILGEGSQREALEAQVRTLRLEGRVALPGADTNPYRWMGRARVFVLPSRFEGSPNVLLEALACGASAVATDCPSGPREILDDGRFGRLVPVGDELAMAAAIEAALDAEHSSKRSTDRARVFSHDTALRRYLAFLDA